MKPLYSILLFLFIGACGKSVENTSPSESARAPSVATEKYAAPVASSTYREAHAAAVTAIEYSAEKGHAWSTADQLLEQAEAAAANGDEDSATQLADRARIQAELAAMQADREATAWHDQVLSE